MQACQHRRPKSRSYLRGGRGQPGAGVLGVLGGWCLCGIPCLLAVIFDHIGMARTRSGERSGHGLAVAGLVLGYIFVLPTAAITILLIVNLADVADFFSGLFG